jgi:hypothetical protein
VSASFDPRRGSIVITGVLTGPAGAIDVPLLLDTGAVMPVIDPGLLEAVGYDLSSSRGTLRIATLSSVETAPIFAVVRLTALGHEWRGLGVIAHRLPAGAPTRGLLGLSFFRDRVLTLDFREGQVTLE